VDNQLQWSDVAVEFESAEAYHARPGISTSRLKKLIESPEAFDLEFNQGKMASKTTDSMDFGSVLHEDVLLEAVERDWLVIPASALAKPKSPGADGARIGKAWEDFKAANPGRLMIKAGDVARIEGCIAGIKANKRAAELLYAGRDKTNAYRVRTEVTITATVSMTYEGELLWDTFRGRLDYIWPRIVVDLKSTGEADIEQLPYRMRDLGYDMQAAAYQTLAGLLDGVSRSVQFVVVETKPPYRCDVWEPKPRTLDEGRQKLERGIMNYLVRKAKGNWIRDYCGQLLSF